MEEVEIEVACEEPDKSWCEIKEEQPEDWTDPLPASDEAGEGEGGEEEENANDPVVIPETFSDPSYTTETATPGSPWEWEPPRPKQNNPGEKPRKPRASNRKKPSDATKDAASGHQDGGNDGEAQAWVGVVGQSKSDGISWGPLTKYGFATFMHACGQAIDFHDFKLKDLIRFTKDLETVDCYVMDSPDYVKATVNYIWDLWTTWNTDSVDDVSYWLMETSVPQIDPLTHAQMLNLKFSTVIALLRRNWNPDLPLSVQTWLNLSADEAQRILRTLQGSVFSVCRPRLKFGRRTSMLEMLT